MKQYLIVLMAIISSSASIAQTQFVSDLNTQWDDFPRHAVELPGGKIAIAMQRTENQSALLHTEAGGIILLTNFQGDLLDSLVLPTGNSGSCRLEGMFSVEDKLVVTLIYSADSQPNYFSRRAGVLILDSNLSVIASVTEELVDSAYFFPGVSACAIDDLIYVLYHRQRINQMSTFVAHPLLNVYDLNGNLLKQKELDTAFFPPIVGGVDYSIYPRELVTDRADLILNCLAGVVLNTSMYASDFLLWIDTSSLELKKMVNYACLDNSCQYLIRSLETSAIFTTPKTAFLGSIGDHIQPCHVLSKYAIPDSSVANNLRPVNFQVLMDTPGLSKPAVTNISAYQNSLYYSGHTYSDLPFYSGAKNKLIIASADTNLNVQWTAYIGGDAYYLPLNILATSDGGCIVLASRYDKVNLPGNKYDPYIFKLDANGNVLSAKELPIAKNIQVEVFPNPASDQLNFRLPEAGEYQIRIYDMNGRMTHSHQFTGKQTTIDIRTSPLGTYTYQLWNNAGRVASGLWLKR